MNKQHDYDFDNAFKHAQMMERQRKQRAAVRSEQIKLDQTLADNASLKRREARLFVAKLLGFGLLAAIAIVGGLLIAMLISNL